LALRRTRLGVDLIEGVTTAAQGVVSAVVMAGVAGVNGLSDAATAAVTDALHDLAGGVSSNVAVITSSNLSRRIDGGRPGRGSSTKPSKRLSMKRRRHLATVCSITRRSAATCLSVAPDAQPTMIRARTANACADFASRCSWSLLGDRQHQIGPWAPRPLNVDQAVHAGDFKSLTALVNRHA
jgi:hypothetical protein